MTGIYLEQQRVRLNRQRQRKVVNFFRKVERITRVLIFWACGVSLLYGAYVLIVEQEYFSIHQVIIRGELEHLDEARIRELSQVALGDHLFQLSMRQIRRQLQAEPWIRSAAVRRKLPHTLWIYIEEREPVALAHADRLYLVDRDGVIFKPVAVDDPTDFPILRGVDDLRWGGEHVGRSAQMDPLLALMETFEKHPLAEQLGCSEVIRDPFGRLAIVTESPLLHLQFGLKPQLAQLDRLSTLLRTVDASQWGPTTVDLSVQRKIVVRKAMRVAQHQCQDAEEEGACNTKTSARNAM